MGKRGHLPPSHHTPPPFGNVVKCFCALVVTAKWSVDELFMHYFHNLTSASGGFAPKHPPGSIPIPHRGTFFPRYLICPPLEKICRRPCPTLLCCCQLVLHVNLLDIGLDSRWQRSAFSSSDVVERKRRSPKYFSGERCSPTQMISLVVPISLDTA